MTTTEERFLTYWKSVHPNIKYKAILGVNGAWVGNDPRNPDSNSKSFTYSLSKLCDGEGGGYNYFVPGKGTTHGTLYELCKELNIEITQKGNGASKPPVDLTRAPTDKPPSKPKAAVLTSATTYTPDKVVTALGSKRAYVSMKDYCDEKRITIKHAEACGWSEVNGTIHMTHTDDNVKRRTRIRKLSENGGWRALGSFKEWCEANDIEWSEKYQKDNYKCFYGFEKAVKAALGNNQPLVLTNGQPSVVVAHFHQINAFAQTDGEKPLQKNLLRRLVDAITTHKLKLIIALDSDEPGRAMAAAVFAQLATHGIDASVIDFGGNNGYDLADFCKQHIIEKSSHALRNLIKLAALRSGLLKAVVDTDDRLHRFKNMLTKKEALAGQVITFPLKAISQVGGFAQYMMPRKATYIYGDTGSGKTIFLETVADKLLQQGVYILWWSPEWDSDEYTWRQIQRQGAATYSQLVEHFIGAKLLTDGQRRAVSAASDTIASWPGKTLCFQTDRFTEHVIARMTDTVLRLRRNNPDVGIVPIFDYAQRMKVLTDEKNRTVYETAMDMVKTFCEQYALHPIVSVQVKKSVSSRADDKMIGLNDAQWVRADFANLVLTLNIMMQNGEKKRMYGKDGDSLFPGEPPRRHYELGVNIVKNSMGKNQCVMMVSDYERLHILDYGEGYGKRTADLGS